VLPVQVALLITTYNRPDALDCVLSSVTRQSRLPDEIVICDDGSDLDTLEVIASWSSRIPTRHVWCPDANFRAALSRNLGILKSQADILIFIDGDCLLPPRFIELHLKMIQPGYLVSGGRHLLTPEKTRSILNKCVALTTAFDNWKFLSWPLGPFRDLLSMNWEAVRTCNLSAHREDVLRIFGFDQAYVGWGREDSDFVVRLIHLGVKIRCGRLAVCVAHLYHPENSRARLSVNEQRFRDTRNNSSHVIPASSILQS
jgi:glycosyltransferase involved in cell wall biosynthesis